MIHNDKIIAVLVPCYNEELTVGTVIEDFKKHLPNAEIYVFDNNSTDKTAEVAKRHGAIVFSENRQGKGNVIRKMFEVVDADIYVMIDGDDTYPAKFVHQVIAPVLSGEADMAVGDRLSNMSYQNAADRGRLGSYGNILFTKFVNFLFNGSIRDVFSGYRAFSRKFAKTVPILSSGFQVEAEMTLFALDKRLNIVETPIDFQERPEGSFSKLSTFKDGFRILGKILNVTRNYRPLFFYSLIAFIFVATSLGLGIPVVIHFLKTGLVPRLPTAILSSSLMIIGLISFIIGLVLDTVSTHNRALYELQFKQYNNLP